jgi:hypothetical protein
MNELEDVLAAEARLKEWLDQHKGGPYPGFCRDLEFLLARLNVLRAEKNRLKVKAKEA